MHVQTLGIQLVVMLWCFALAVVDLTEVYLRINQLAWRGVVRPHIQDAVKSVWSSPMWWLKEAARKAGLVLASDLPPFPTIEKSEDHWG